MTTKEKAIEIANKFTRKSVFEMDNDELKVERGEAKKQAKICIKEIVTELNKLPSKDLSDLQYWSEVDYEISLL